MNALTWYKSKSRVIGTIKITITGRRYRHAHITDRLRNTKGNLIRRLNFRISVNNDVMQCCLIRQLLFVSSWCCEAYLPTRGANVGTPPPRDFNGPNYTWIIILEPCQRVHSAMQQYIIILLLCNARSLSSSPSQSVWLRSKDRRRCNKIGIQHSESFTNSQVYSIPTK